MAAMLGPNDLIASHYSISGADVMKPARHSFAERVAAVAAAGFAGIGWTPEDYDACRAAGLTDVQMRAILADHGVRVAELEFVSDWAHGGERGAAARKTEERMYRMADLFAPRHMNVGELRAPAEMEPLEASAERFAALCDRAAAHGLLVAIEFLPWTGIPDPAAAWKICRLAGRRNGGLLVDAWHYFHTGADAATLRSVPPDQIVAIQFDDAPRMSSGTEMLYDTLHRCAPGKGVFPLIDFIRLLDELGVKAPISVEIISPDLEEMPIALAARVAHDSSAEVIARARNQ